MGAQRREYQEGGTRQARIDEREARLNAQNLHELGEGEQHDSDEHGLGAQQDAHSKSGQRESSESMACLTSTGRIRVCGAAPASASPARRRACPTTAVRTRACEATDEHESDEE